MIKITNIKKSFNENTVLDGISFDVKKGDVIAIIGPSGTGKSTLLRCLNYLEKADAGEIDFDGEKIDFTNITKEQISSLRKKTSMVFQQWNLFKKKTVLQNVMLGLTVVQKLPKEEARKIAIEELTKVKMADRLNYYPQHLSGGQQQRVAIARAIAMNPELILFDEPTSALDPELVGEVLETIQKLANEGNTMIIVSHEMNFVRKVATKVIFMEKGKIVESGTAEEIFSYPKNERRRQFLINNQINISPEYSI